VTKELSAKKAKKSAAVEETSGESELLDSLPLKRNLLLFLFSFQEARRYARDKPEAQSRGDEHSVQSKRVQGSEVHVHDE
jgi:hypothetical protein